MAASGAAIVYNTDIVGLIERIQRFYEELLKSQSSNVSGMNQYDQDRLRSYLDAIDRYHAHIMQDPLLDLPETSPREYVIKPMLSHEEVESEDVADILRLFSLAVGELQNSQAARQASTLNTHDSRRLTAITAKARRFLEDYVVPTQPIDLPESSPAQAMSGPGRGGV